MEGQGRGGGAACSKLVHLCFYAGAGRRHLLPAMMNGTGARCHSHLR